MSAINFLTDYCVVILVLLVLGAIAFSVMAFAEQSSLANRKDKEEL